MDTPETYTAFEGTRLLCHGELTHVVMKVKKRLEKSSDKNVLIFSDHTGKTMDFNFHGSDSEVQRRLEVFVGGGEAPSPAGPGRPKLGVISREVSLLPRHWEWLATQPGGASATLRKLIEDARKKTAGAVDVKQAQERAYKFMNVLAGDLSGYEEALRALYRKDKKGFASNIEAWPKDVKDHALALAKPVFS